MDSDQIQDASTQLHAGEESLEEILNEEVHTRRLATRLGLQFSDLKEVSPDPELFRTVPVDLMLKHSFLPLERTPKGLKIAIADPSNVVVLDELEVLLDSRIHLVVATSSSIQDLLKKSETSQRVLEEASEDFRLQVVREDEESGEEVVSIERISEDSSPIIRLVDSTLFDSLQRRASDIHIETRDDEVVIKYRVDGVLIQAMDPIDKRFHATIVSRIKVMSELDIAEKRIPQDGRFRIRFHGRNIDFRVSVIPTVHGEDVVIRILDKESANDEFKELRLDILGFDEDILYKVRRHIKEPYGMFLVTGPTGSGKTTTLYGALSEIQTEEDKIVTIEDPVEYQLKGITQIPVNEKKGLTFARGLRSILRHDPDKIMVGEIRDEETADIAVQSALTGHLVFTTVHANNVVDVIGRFMNMKVEPYNFVSALNAVLAQRLVRKLCPNCRVETSYTQIELEESLIPKELWDRTFFSGTGCLDCNGTGFKGRMAISELLEISDTIREMILDRRPASEIKRQARKDGMTTLRESAVRTLAGGFTTLHEINKVTFIEH